MKKKYDNVLVGGKIANEIKRIPFGEKVMLPSDFIDDRLDIGPETLERFKNILNSAATIVWNGPKVNLKMKKYSGAMKFSAPFLQALLQL